MNSRKMFGRLVAAVVLVAVLCASCVTTVPMTDGEPVDVEKIFMGSAYYQEEANLAPNTVAEVLESYEETESYVQSYKLRRIGYSVFSGIGSIMMIGAAVTNITGSYFTGAGLALGGSHVRSRAALLCELVQRPG
jgi:hypothetical protein